MTPEQSDRKIKEILTKTNGQSKLAEQAIRALTEKDHGFLLSLVQPYLGGIILHGIERARKLSGIKEPVATSKPAKEVLPKVAAKSKSAEPSFTGNALDGLMKAWAKRFDDGKPAEVGSKNVSQKHMDAMNALVKNTGKTKK